MFFSNLKFSLLTQEILSSCVDFSCSQESDIEHFFKNESLDYEDQLLGKSYCFTVEEEGKLHITSAFTLSNTSIRVFNLPSNKRNRLNRKIPNPKRKNQYPAVLIGQLAVFDEYHKNDLGAFLLNFIKSWMLDKSQTGCRFIVVDAINKPKVLDFYEHNGFTFMFSSADEEMQYRRGERNNHGGTTRISRTLTNKKQAPEYKDTRLMYFDLLSIK